MENLPAIQNGSMFFDVARFEHAQRVAKVFAQSTMVPEHFRNNIGNTLIAMNYADRIGADLFMCMQSMCVIHGKPGIEGKLVISLINNSGRFDPVEFDEIGNLRKPENDEDGCIAYAKDLKSGKILKGPLVDWAMVKAEGWYGKNVSKWKTMAPLMFRYRAATYFARTYCPEVLLGMQTREELRDIVTLQQNDLGEYATTEDTEPSSVNSLPEQRDTSLYSGCIGGSSLVGGTMANDKKENPPTEVVDPKKTNEKGQQLGAGMDEEQLWEILVNKVAEIGITTQGSFQKVEDYVKYNADFTGYPLSRALQVAINTPSADLMLSVTDWYTKQADTTQQQMHKNSGANSRPPENTSLDGLPQWNEKHPLWKENWWGMRSGDFKKGTGLAYYINLHAKTLDSVPEDIQRELVDKHSRVYPGQAFPYQLKWFEAGEDGVNDDDQEMTDAELRVELRAARTDLVQWKQQEPDLFKDGLKNLLQKGSIVNKIPAQMSLDECNALIDEIKSLKELQSF